VHSKKKKKKITYTSVDSTGIHFHFHPEYKQQVHRAYPSVIDPSIIFLFFGPVLVTRRANSGRRYY
jgi:hypothetical protein